MTVPNYEGTAAEYAQFGVNLSIWEQLRLIQAWSPLIGYAQRFVSEGDPYRKSLVVGDAAEWMALKTNSVTDDELVKLFAALLKTDEGEALVRWCLAQVEGAT